MGSRSRPDLDLDLDLGDKFHGKYVGLPDVRSSRAEPVEPLWRQIRTNVRSSVISSIHLIS